MTQTKKNEFNHIPDKSPLAALRDLISAAGSIINALNGAIWDARKTGKAAEVNTLVLLALTMLENERFEAIQIAQDLGIDTDLYPDEGVFLPPPIED